MIMAVAECFYRGISAPCNDAVADYSARGLSISRSAKRMCQSPPAAFWSAVVAWRISSF